MGRHLEGCHTNTSDRALRQTICTFGYSTPDIVFLYRGKDDVIPRDYEEPREATPGRCILNAETRVPFKLFDAQNPFSRGT